MKIKNAFTLAEVLLVFIIIGIIAAIGLKTVKPSEKAYKYAYTRMYNALSLSIYNYMINTDGDFPSTGDEFCAALLEYMNTSDNATSCSGNNLSRFAAFQESYVRIRTSNGAKLWIGTATTGGFLTNTQTVTLDSSTTTDTVKFYIVFVDINGDKGPNTAEWKKTRMSDIVAFLVTDKFKVIPIGYPVVDKRYMSAYVIYPTQNDDYTTDDNTTVSSDAMSYYEAKVNAYGDKVVYGNVETYDFTSSFNANLISWFKVDDYDKYYTTAPEFDETNCDFDEGEDAVCEVKIYDYH